MHIFELTVPELANFARSGRHDERMVSNKMGGGAIVSVRNTPNNEFGACRDLL